MKTPADVYGRHDLIGALRDRPGLVERHFRLWLSSTAVLQTVLNKAAHLRSSWLRDELMRIADTFVPHDGFERAREMLGTQHVCVITGAPRVGKTTVAMMLAYWLMGQDYQVHEITRDVDEIHDLWRDDEPQMFLYDDFLGRTMLDQPNRNEDRRLVSLIRRIRETPGKAFVMTTREHILNQARLRSDQLDGRDVTVATSAVELTDLDMGVRGQIVYNYVSRSAIALQEKARFADPTVWRPIVTHRKFNPRLIQETLRLADTHDRDVAALMRANLEDPLHIWERIVEHELPDEAVHLLEVLFLDDGASVDELARSWSEYRRSMGRGSDRRLYRQAVGLLDGSLIRIERESVSFHNPSVEDYFRHHLSVGRADFSAILDIVENSQQTYRLMEIAAATGGEDVLSFLRNNRGRIESAIVSAHQETTYGFVGQHEDEGAYLD
ncbi:hypothetical protein JIG36_36395 [Actinoplanes sp. LDG1-06]|uniref:Novel STAND NTPase 3 domain-containing protein n=1 Tax=Paractinoplanes ovalisporus TaxID=2810368 RepID=A0ABS2AMH4_9ACTN|nr:hypothetical protein [Actinoplanes ovalisporus]MBM2620995.1 hypothetical protein [Actinoplanes ovalisporus]